MLVDQIKTIIFITDNKINEMMNEIALYKWESFKLLVNVYKIIYYRYQNLGIMNVQTCFSHKCESIIWVKF